MLKCSNESIWHYCLFNSVPSLQPVNVPCHALILNLNNTISENRTDFTIELRKKAEKVGFSWNKGENRWYWNPSSQCVKGTRLNKFGCICDGICFEKMFCVDCTMFLSSAREFSLSVSRHFCLLRVILSLLVFSFSKFRWFFFMYNIFVL